MPFIEVKLVLDQCTILLNTDQIVAITTPLEYPRVSGYTSVITSSGNNLTIDMKPEELLKAIEDANATPTLTPQPSQVTINPEERERG